jgi:FkbM family methyltransferase
MIKSLVHAFLVGYLKNNKKYRSYFRWLLANGDEKLRYNYNLNKESVVFDLGGYHGEFSEKINSKYGSKIYLFEPIEEFFKIAAQKLSAYPNVKCFQFAIGVENKTDYFNLAANETSSFSNQNARKEEVRIVHIGDFLSEQKILKIDLIKINIEGGEYDILDYLLKNGLINRFVNLQIQFHDFVENAPSRRDEIRKQLSKTHECTYNFEFIWENWRLRK